MHLLPLLALLASSPVTASELDAAVDFFAWLENHAKDFATCEPVKEGDHYVLCDKTRVPAAELKRMFAMKPEELVTTLKSKDLKIELVCDEAAKSPPLPGACVKGSTNKTFSEVTSLHGKYLPDEKTILIRSSASPGSLVHEFIHSLQSENGEEVYGKAYKKRRNEIQRALTALMDAKIKEVQALEGQGKKAETRTHLQEFMIASEAVRGFAPWQDLIDERGIFLLYLKFGKELGIPAGDLALARKNMGFICRNPKLTKLLPPKQCKL